MDLAGQDRPQGDPDGQDVDDLLEDGAGGGWQESGGRCDHGDQGQADADDDRLQGDAPGTGAR